MATFSLTPLRPDFLTVPDAWLDVLRKVQRVCPEAALAGGALRDLAFGSEPKDIDIFINARDPGDWLYKAGLIVEHLGTEDDVEALNASVDSDKFLDDYRMWAGFEFIGQFEFPVAGLAPKVNLVGLDGNAMGAPGFCLRTVVERIDLSLCQLGTDGRELLPSMAFMVDREKRRFTITRLDQTWPQMDRTIQRWERFRRRAAYRNFPLVIHQPAERDGPVDFGL